MTDQAERTWVVGVPRSTRSDLFASLKLRTNVERVTAIVVAVLALALPNLFVQWRNELLSVLIPFALVTYLLLWKKDRQGNSLIYAGAKKIGIASGKNDQHYKSGALWTGTLIEDGKAIPRPVPPPAWIGNPRFNEAANGMGIVQLPHEASVTAVIELRGQGTDRRSPEGRASDHDRLTLILEGLARQESFIDRIAYIDYVQAPDGTANIRQLPPIGDMPITLDESYRDAWRETEDAGESHRYLLVCRMTTTQKVKDLIHSRRKRGDKDRDYYYAELMSEQMVGVIGELHATRHNIVMQPGPNGSQRETWSKAQLQQYVGLVLDPAYDGDGTEHPNTLWPTDTAPETQYMGCLGSYGWNYSRSFVITDWPQERVTAGGMTKLWTLPDRRDDPSRPQWAIRRANVLVIELIDRDRGLKTAKIEASSDLTAIQKRVDNGEISVDAAQATNSVQRLVDIHQGNATPVLATVIITTWTDEPDDFDYIERTIKSAARGIDVKVRAADNEHGLALATALPCAVGIHRDKTWRGKK